MSTFRSPAAIEADIAAAALLLARLEAERARSRALRRAGILADFDAGMDQRAIAAKWAMPYGQVAAVLHKAGRSQRARRRASLSAAQRPHYDKLLRMGLRGRLAQSIARVVAP